MKFNNPKVLIIAGSDPSGGAGIQADIKTATANKVYSSTVITCLTAQNTKKVSAIHNPPIHFLRSQIEEVLEDISFDTIKTGMLGNSEIINCVADVLKKKAKRIPLVLDPVMVATSGDLLLEKSAVQDLKRKLIKKCYIITPNIDEAEILSEIKIKNLDDMKSASKIIQKIGAKNVLIKGGHLKTSGNYIYSVLLVEDGSIHLIKNKKINSKSFHGTGCTLASAIASNLAKGLDIVDAVKKANAYVYKAVKNNLKVGKGSLVLKHF